MAKKIYRFAVSIGLPDPSQDRPAVIRNGRTVRAATKGSRFIPAGTPVELDEKLGKALLARHGEYREKPPQTTITFKP